ncbi:MAG TPA: helix-turn-helix transcriptional regulator, partial [Candidatus Syntrophosphaera sp.]|nr:helix-turn-helix transcriptional regulator [Candidatus Syntrophosphaera sp.]
MEYKDLLEELLRALKISKKKFAEGLNLSQGNVSDWFNRPGYRPSIDALRKISQIYNVNLNWLITGTGSMFLLNDRARVGVDAVPPNPSPLHIPVVADIAAGNGIEAFDV